MDRLLFPSGSTPYRNRNHRPLMHVKQRQLTEQERVEKHTAMVRKSFSKQSSSDVMESSMKLMLSRFGTAAAAALAIALAGCGGGGSDTPTPPPVDTTPPPPTQSVSAALSAAAAQSANDTATAPTAAFTVVQARRRSRSHDQQRPEGELHRVLRRRDQEGPGLGQRELRDRQAGARHQRRAGQVGQLRVPQGSRDRRRRPERHARPGLRPCRRPSDPKQTDAALAAAQLVYNPDGYYTYTFRADVTNPNWTATASNTAYSTNGVDV